VYENEAHNGIAELLEILGSIINGFTLPLKDEHKDFLVKALIPLHKPKTIATYHPQLSYCIAQYIEKDPSLTELVFKKILAYWPITNSSKQLLFLSEIEEILCVVEPEQFIIIQEMLFKRVSECISSTHFQIAEKALTLWNNEYILSLVAENVEAILPIVFPALYWDAKSHWNKAIRSMAYTAIRLFMDIDETIFGRVIEDYKQKRKSEKEDREKRVTNWKSLFQTHDPQALVVDETWKTSSVPPAPGTTESPLGSHLSEDEKRMDPLMNDNDGLPLSVKIPHHMKQLVADEFDITDPVFRELNELHQIQMNKKLRRKELLPVDRITADAMSQHVSLDDLAGGEEYSNYDTETDEDDDYSSSYDSYSDGEGGAGAGGAAGGAAAGAGGTGGGGGGEGDQAGHDGDYADDAGHDGDNQ